MNKYISVLVFIFVLNTFVISKTVYPQPSVVCYLDFKKYFPNCYVSKALAYYDENCVQICIYKIRLNDKIYEGRVPIKDIKNVHLE